MFECAVYTHTGVFPSTPRALISPKLTFPACYRTRRWWWGDSGGVPGGGEGGVVPGVRGGGQVGRLVVGHRGTGPGGGTALFPHCVCTGTTVPLLWLYWHHCTSTVAVPAPLYPLWLYWCPRGGCTGVPRGGCTGVPSGG